MKNVYILISGNMDTGIDDIISVNSTLRGGMSAAFIHLGKMSGQWTRQKDYPTRWECGPDYMELLDFEVHQ